MEATSNDVAPRSAETIARALVDARDYTNGMYRHLSTAQEAFPRTPIVNPPRWEVGHIGWFQEFWCRRYAPDDPRGARTPSHLPHADAWWDSARVTHATRWDLPLPAWDAIDAYLATTLEETLARLASSRDGERYFYELALYHEDMHGEALLMTLQTLALPPPQGWRAPAVDLAAPSPDIAMPGGTHVLGAARDAPAQRFVFDNEKWAHAVDLAPFAIAARCVRNDAFAAFVEDGGYRRRALWSEAGWAWRESRAADHPRDWRKRDGAWEQRVFDAWQPLVMSQSVRQVSAYEAEAWCAWAGRRLPTEAEWEGTAGKLAPGGVWEWTATSFSPYPGFTPDPYAEYSEPWFGDHRVLRGASFATKSRLAHPGFRNFYRPERCDMFVGFRTCATAR